MEEIEAERDFLDSALRDVGVFGGLWKTEEDIVVYP